MLFAFLKKKTLRALMPLDTKNESDRSYIDVLQYKRHKKLLK